MRISMGLTSGNIFKGGVLRVGADVWGVPMYLDAPVKGSA